MSRFIGFNNTSVARTASRGVEPGLPTRSRLERRKESSPAVGDARGFSGPEGHHYAPGSRWDGCKGPAQLENWHTAVGTRRSIPSGSVQRTPASVRLFPQGAQILSIPMKIQTTNVPTTLQPVEDRSANVKVVSKATCTHSKMAKLTQATFLRNTSEPL